MLLQASSARGLLILIFSKAARLFQGLILGLLLFSNPVLAQNKIATQGAAPSDQGLSVLKIPEIKAEASGTVVEVVAENGKPVQYGQVLFRIRAK